MTELVVFVEEESARIVIESLANRFAPGRIVRVLPHDGKMDLRKSFPRKIRAWQHPPDVRFLILYDNDGADCLHLKRELTAQIDEARRERTRIRIVMQALEAWYLGDEQALLIAGLISEKVAQTMQQKVRFRDPDAIPDPKSVLISLVQQQGQLRLARLIAPHLDPLHNRSRSFKVFCRTLKELLD
jgi:hypothetical protein